MFGKCPKCGEAVLHLNQKQIQTTETFNEASFPAVAVHCPNTKCQTVLGVLPNYWTLVDDVANQVISKLTKQSR